MIYPSEEERRLPDPVARRGALQNGGTQPENQHGAVHGAWRTVGYCMDIQNGGLIWRQTRDGVDVQDGGQVSRQNGLHGVVTSKWRRSQWEFSVACGPRWRPTMNVEFSM